MLQQQQQQQQQEQERESRAVKKQNHMNNNHRQEFNDIYEELPEEKSPKHVSIGKDELIPDIDNWNRRGSRTVSYKPGSSASGFGVVGGNVTGVFVSTVDEGGPAKKAGIHCGDQILKINGKSTKSKTREEVIQMVNTITSSSTGKVDLVVRNDPTGYSSATEDKKSDCVHVKARFVHVPTKKGELAIQDGEIFTITDSLPVDHFGFWRATRAYGRPDAELEGLIPNKQKAEQMLVRKQLTTGSADKKGGALLRSFRRTKSVDRSNKGKDSADESCGEGGVIAYERVEQKPAGHKRPVIVMGLFCDTVRDMLVRDSPGLFEVPPGDVERRDPSAHGTGGGSDVPPVNVRLIRSITNCGKHCLMIISPRAVQYLTEKTDLRPMVLYLSPVSKVVLKTIKAKMAPNMDKKLAFIYDEAVKFEKAHSTIFNAIVPYKADGTWFSLLKDSIDRIQKQPQWITVIPTNDITPKEDDLTMNELDEPQARQSPDLIRTTKKGSGWSASVKDHQRSQRRISKTTDDIPDQIQDLLSRHMSSTRSPVRENGQQFFGNDDGQEGKQDGDILRYLKDDDSDLSPTSSTGYQPKSILKNGKSYSADNTLDQSQASIEYSVSDVSSTSSAKWRQQKQQLQPGVSIKPPKPSGAGSGSRQRNNSATRSGRFRHRNPTVGHLNKNLLVFGLVLSRVLGYPNMHLSKKYSDTK